MRGYSTVVNYFDHRGATEERICFLPKQVGGVGAQRVRYFDDLGDQE